MPDLKAATTGHSEAWVVPGCAERGDAENAFAFRQLRHQAKNVLQRILLRIEEEQYAAGEGFAGRWLLAGICGAASCRRPKDFRRAVRPDPFPGLDVQNGFRR